MDEPSAAGRPPARFAVWRLMVWLVLLFVLAQSRWPLRHAWLLWRQAHGGLPVGHAPLPGFAWLEWLWLAAILAIVAVTIGCLLGRAWGRAAMRIVAVLLALWLVAGAAMILVEWHALDGADGAFLRQAFGDAGTALIARMHWADVLDLALDLAGALGLGWLAWQLGTPAVRATFAPAR